MQRVYVIESAQVTTVIYTAFITFIPYTFHAFITFIPYTFHGALPKSDLAVI